MCTCSTPTNDPNFRDSFERTPLHYAVRFGNVDRTLVLLQNGAEVNVVDAFGCTPLSLACVDKPDLKVVKLLLKYGADVNLERLSGIDLLLECALNCSTPLQTRIIKTLIEYGKNVNATDEISNRSCMHLVAITGYVPLAKLLLKMGGIVNIRDDFNCTPMILSKNHGNIDVLNLFQNYLTENRLI